MAGSRSLTIVVALAGVFGVSIAAIADLTPEHRKSIGQVVKDVGKVGALVRKKEFDEAEKALAEADEKIKTIVTEANVKEEDKAFNSARAAITKARKSLELARDKAAGKKPEPKKGISFATDVAPIITDNCVGCHGPDRASGGLRLDTFAYWRRGGRSGAIISPAGARGSLLTLKLTAADAAQRMPKDEDALSQEKIETIATWINQGARFDGGNENASLADVTANVKLAAFDYPKPKGTETVSFTKDIAPWFANLCGNCHSAQRKSGGLSLVSYFDLMQGGESGDVIIPGDKENSRLFRLVGGLDLPRMPQGQARITRKNYNDLVKWFEEGNTFDGSDPRTPLSTFVRSDEEVAREKFAGMSDEERRKMREDRTDEQWRKAFPKEGMNRVDDLDLLIAGNVEPERLTTVQGWARDHLTLLRKTFRPAEGALWKGRLTLFVLKDRFAYDEFSLSIDGREAPKEMTGHSVVTANDEDAYVVVQDIGDEASTDSPGLQVNVIDHLTGAFLKRGGAQVPAWVARGAGLALASRQTPANPYLKVLPSQAAGLAGSVPNPEDIFAEGTFSPGTIGPVGLSLVEFLMDSGGAPKFAQFTAALAEGRSTADAAKAVYGVDLPSLAQQYLAAQKRKR